MTLDSGSALTGEARLHRVDGPLEYSYRLFVRLLYDLPVLSR